MPRKLPNLNSLRVFEAAARHLSFSLAANELYVTQAAVSRQIKALEAFLGVSLFNRLARAVELTALGEEYFIVVRDVLNRLEQAGKRIVEQHDHSILTLNTLPTFGFRWLVPRLKKFAMLHPDIDVQLITDLKPVSFDRDNIDAAIRVGNLPTSDLVPGYNIGIDMVENWTNVRAELLMPDILVPVCSPRLQIESGPWSTPTDLLRYPLIKTVTRPNSWLYWFRENGINADINASGPTYGHFFMAMEVAIDGRGIALVPHVLAETDIASGKLMIPFNSNAKCTSGNYYFLSSYRAWETDNIRKFRKWLLTESKYFNTSSLSWVSPN